MSLYTIKKVGMVQRGNLCREGYGEGSRVAVELWQKWHRKHAEKIAVLIERSLDLCGGTGWIASVLIESRDIVRSYEGSGVLGPALLMTPCLSLSGRCFGVHVFTELYDVSKKSRDHSIFLQTFVLDIAIMISLTLVYSIHIYFTRDVLKSSSRCFV